MSILLAHEMGHFWVARIHRFHISLPWFLPFPYLIGTLGALIRFKDKPRNRTGLLEMAAAGPIVGFVMICVVLCCRAWAPVEPIDAVHELELSTPIIFYIAQAVFGGSLSVSVNEPLAFAAWIGCLVTTLNLLPLGQLDGGHILYALQPGRVKWVGRLVTLGLVLGGVFWLGWLVWAALIHTLGKQHPVDIRRPETRVTKRGVVSACLCLLIWALCFTVIPVRIIG
jgi:membrane-associated protease RseP (regulator of RpoE activity)